MTRQFQYHLLCSFDFVNPSALIYPEYRSGQPLSGALGTYEEWGLMPSKDQIFLRDSLENDRAKHSILPLSKFGLMQITRQRVRPEMHVSTTEKCPTCNGTGEISPSILFVDTIENHILSILEKEKHSMLELKLHPYVAAYIKRGLIPLQLKWRFRFKTRIKVVSISSYDFLEYHIFNARGEEIVG